MVKIYDLPLHEAAEQRRRARMEKIDSMSPEMRAVVNDYGYHIVASFLQHKITKPRIIRHLVETVLDEFSPTRGSFACQGIRTQVKELEKAK